jgi:tetratricopeptide (TPR) repeat protein
MSAAPLPKPDDAEPAAEPVPVREPATAADADGWALLEGLRRRLDDQTSQGRKTQQQVSQLAESIAALVDTQRRRTRNLNLNSFVAYLIFTMLCGAGFYLLYSSRAHELVDARERAEHERDAAVRRADDLTAKSTAREQADGRAWDIYQLLETHKRTEATAKLDASRDLPLSRTERAILAARAHETQVMEVEAALKAAAASLKAGRHADMIAPLEAALSGEPAGARSASMHYYLGVAYAKVGPMDKAIAHLQTAVGADVDQEDARFQLASALDRSGAYAKARGEYDRFATAHPQSSLAVFAMRRSSTLARMPATAPVAPGAAPAPAPKPQVVPQKPPVPARPPVVAPPPAKPAPQDSTADPGSTATP